MYYILVFLLIITIITITIYLFTKSSSCKDKTRIYTDKDNIEKCCQKDLCNKMCCRDDQICDPKQGLGLCQYTYDCNEYDCVITKGGKYIEPTCGSKCPKRPTPTPPKPSSSSFGTTIGIVIGTVFGFLVIFSIGIYFIYYYNSKRLIPS